MVAKTKLYVGDIVELNNHTYTVAYKEPNYVLEPYKTEKEQLLDKALELNIRLDNLEETILDLLKEVKKLSDRVWSMEE